MTEPTPRRHPDDPVDADLAALAAAYGVAVGYDDWASRPVPVAAATVRRVLAELGVDAADASAVAAARTAAELAPWRRLVAPTVVVRVGETGPVVVHVPAGVRPSARVVTEDGATVPVAAVGVPGAQRSVDGLVLHAVPLSLPPDLPSGWHRLAVTAAGREEQAVLLVAPSAVGLPAGLGRGWGWMVQLYAVRSAASWGMGDYADLAELARWSAAEHGADVLLVNPLHAEAPVHPVQPSPYSPSSRRFRSPLSLRVEDVAEYAEAPAAVRDRVDALGAPLRASAGMVDRDAVWDAKITALELLHAQPRADSDAVAAYRQAQGEGLVAFATFCALAERHGLPFSSWPPELRHPGSPAVTAARAELAERVDLYCWLQHCCDTQLAAAQAAALGAGMRLGIVHDLAVGVDPGGADGWALSTDLAGAVTVGAPPDSFNQRGQGWGLPPYRPDRLPATGYAALRDMTRGVLRHAGGLRVDHVMGLFRLWWVPAGSPPAEGTYVSYDAPAMLGVLALEAERAGAVLVGEDLGTVEPVVTRLLRDRGVLGSAVLWFERAEDPRTGADTGPLPPARWRELAMASVTTHDLPTAAGFLADEHVRVRAELGQLGHGADVELARVAKERGELLGLLRAEGLLGADADRRDTVLAMHRLLVRSPCRLVLGALWDATGDLRQPNLPGTTEEYPSWRLPLADGGGRPVTLEQVQASAEVAELAEVLRTARS